MKKRFLAVAMVLAIFVCGIFVSAIADSGGNYDSVSLLYRDIWTMW